MKLHSSLARLQSAVLPGNARDSGQAPGSRATREAAHPSPQMIPLNRALLCVNCELITETKRDCPRCGSKQLIKVTQIAGGSIYTRAAGACSDRRADHLLSCERDRRGLLR